MMRGRNFQYVPLKGDKGQVVEMLFPGSHSDVGGLYDDNHLVADLALAWIAAGAVAVRRWSEGPSEWIRRIRRGSMRRSLRPPPL